MRLAAWSLDFNLFLAFTPTAFESKTLSLLACVLCCALLASTNIFSNASKDNADTTPDLPICKMLRANSEFLVQ